MPATSRTRVVVSGQVQGVFFRDSCRERAEAAGLSGWVRNLDDGRVEAVFEGDRDAVAGLVRWCAEGPEKAAVRDVQSVEETPTGERGFTIR
jgi:acylphosphatase